MVDCVTLILLVWFGSYSYLYIYNLGGPKPLYSYLVLIAVSIVYLCYAAAAQMRIAERLFALLLWLGLYLAYGGFEFLRSNQGDIAVQTLVTLGEAVVIVWAFLALLAEHRRVELAAASLALLALLGSAVDIFDFVRPTLSSIPGRAAGFYENPTIAGNFIALAMVAGSCRIPPRWRWWYLVFCGAGIAVTFSRESWILWAAAIAGLTWLGTLGIGRVRWVSLLALVLVGTGLILSLFVGQLGRAVLSPEVGAYLTPDTTARLGIGASSLSDEAARQRFYEIRYSLDLAAEAPLLGYGLGYTQIWDFSKGPHDMYLLFLVEGGAIGLVLYLSLLGVLWCNSVGLGRVLTAQILISSFFSHNHLEQPAILLVIAFIVAHGAVYRSRQSVSLHKRDDSIWRLN